MLEGETVLCADLATGPPVRGDRIDRMERRTSPLDDTEAQGEGSSDHGVGDELAPVAVPLPDDLFISSETPARRRPRRPALLRPLLAGVVLGVALGWPLPSQPGTAGVLLERVLRLVGDRYVDPVDTEQLLYDGLDEMLRELDPNSRFYSPDELEEFDADTDGFFVGIGVVIEPAKEGVPPTIKAVIPESPAKRADLQRGDQILAVAGDPVEQSTLDQVSQRIKGPPGSSVIMTLRRRSEDGQYTDHLVEVQRERVTLPSVQAVRLYPGANSPIGYVRLDQFQSGSTGEVEQSFTNLTAAGARKFVLDLRGNRGGYLDEAVRICDLFVGGGLVLSTKGRSNVDKPELYRASGQTLFPDQPLVILIDGFSASASEIVAAALQDRRRALLLGEESYGKWSVQDVIRLPNRDGIVKLTTKSHHPPAGRWIRRDDDGRRLGLVPNVPVKIDGQARVALQRRWRESLLQTIETPYAVVSAAPPTFEPDGPDSVVDAPLVRALAILSNGTDYEKILAVDPDPLALGTATAKTDRATPRGSTHTPSGDATTGSGVKPAVEQSAEKSASQPDG